MFKQSKEPEKKGSEKREDLLVSFLIRAHFVFAIILGSLHLLLSTTDFHRPNHQIQNMLPR